VADGQCTLTFTSAGAKSLTASYAGDATFGASSSAFEAHTVAAADTVTTITADSPDPSTQGAAVTVHYTVTADAPGAGTPTGNVRVSDGVDSCTAVVAAGQCTLALSTVGSRTLTATYAGDGNFRASSSSGKPHTINPPISPAGQPPTGNPASSPLAHVSGASLTHRRFRVSPRRQLAQISRRRPPVGTTFKYTLDTAATVRFDFSKARAGRNVDGKCVAVNKHNRRKPRCALQRGALTFAGHAGTNTVRFSGWLSRTKKLAPGRYELTITAITPGVGASSQQLRFTIVR
jgi:hypothetical protein